MKSKSGRTGLSSELAVAADDEECGDIGNGYESIGAVPFTGCSISADFLHLCRWQMSPPKKATWTSSSPQVRNSQRFVITVVELTAARDFPHSLEDAKKIMSELCEEKTKEGFTSTGKKLYGASWRHRCSCTALKALPTCLGAPTAQLPSFADPDKYTCKDLVIPLQPQQILSYRRCHSTDVSVALDKRPTVSVRANAYRRRSVAQSSGDCARELYIDPTRGGVSAGAVDRVARFVFTSATYDRTSGRRHRPQATDRSSREGECGPQREIGVAGRRSREAPDALNLRTVKGKIRDQR